MNFRDEVLVDEMGFGAGYNLSPNFYSSAGDILSKTPSALRQIVARTPAGMLGSVTLGGLHSMGVDAQNENLDKHAQILSEQNPNDYREPGTSRISQAKEDAISQQNEHVNNLYKGGNISLNDAGIPVTLPFGDIAKGVHEVFTPIAGGIFEGVPNMISKTTQEYFSPPAEVPAEYYFSDSQSTALQPIAPPVVEVSEPQKPPPVDPVEFQGFEDDLELIRELDGLQ
jgi:hypothetical protein